MLLDIESILSDCDILEDICVLECKNFKTQIYERIFKGQLIINDEKKISIIICIPEKWYRDLVDIYISRITIKLNFCRISIIRVNYVCLNWKEF